MLMKRGSPFSSLPAGVHAHVKFAFEIKAVIRCVSAQGHQVTLLAILEHIGRVRLEAANRQDGGMKILPAGSA